MQKGVAPIWLLLGILTMLAVVGGAYYIGKFQISKLKNSVVTYQSPQPSASVPITVDGKSGIVGKVVLGPSCPVVRPGVDDKCQDKPYQATVTVKTSDGTREITRFTSDAEGNFKVNLAPGNYLLVSASDNRFPFSKPQNVTVERDQFTSVTISYDTGIR